jgi:hypothetical protein
MPGIVGRQHREDASWSPMYRCGPQAGLARGMSIYRGRATSEFSARPAQFAWRAVLAAEVLGAALVAGCAHVPHQSVETPVATEQATEEVMTRTAAPPMGGTPSASGYGDLEEVVTTGQHRRPPIRTPRPGGGSSSPGHAPAAATAATDAAAAGQSSGTAPPTIDVGQGADGAAPGHSAAAGEPRYEANLTNSVLTQDHEEVLSVAVSTRLTREALHALVMNRLKSASGSATARPGSTVDVGGELETEVWYQFKFVLARVECPTFVDCGKVNPQSRSNDPLIWDWPLAAKQSDETRSGNIIVTFYGDQSPGGQFEQTIASMPPLKIEVKVYRGMSYWDAVAKGVSDLLTQFKGILIGVAAIAAILVGWKKKIWRVWAGR